MKRRLAYLATLTSFIILFLVYCSKRPGSQEKAIPLEQPLSVIKAIDPEAEYFSGSIQVTTNKDGDIIVLVNGKDTAHSTLFFIQGANRNISKTMDQGEVIYLMHSIIINSLEKKERYYLAVPKDEEKFVYGKIPASYKTFFSGRAEGYSVVRMKGALPDDIGPFNDAADPYSVLAAYRQKLYHSMTGNTVTTDLGGPGGGIGGVACDDGGEGATSCGVSQGAGHTCSVSCPTGYYACCSLGFVNPVCKCIKNRMN